MRNGLDDTAFAGRHRPRADVVYLGRLDVAQKGLDLLLDAYARVAGTMDCDLLRRQRARRGFAQGPGGSLHLGSRVRFLGRWPTATASTCWPVPGSWSCPAGTRPSGWWRWKPKPSAPPSCHSNPLPERAQYGGDRRLGGALRRGCFCLRLSRPCPRPATLRPVGCGRLGVGENAEMGKAGPASRGVYLRAVREAAVPRHRARAGADGRQRDAAPAPGSDLLSQRLGLSREPGPLVADVLRRRGGRGADGGRGCW